MKVSFKRFSEVSLMLLALFIFSIPLVLGVVIVYIAKILYCLRFTVSMGFAIAIFQSKKMAKKVYSGKFWKSDIFWKRARAFLLCVAFAYLIILAIVFAFNDPLKSLLAVAFVDILIGFI